MRIALFDSLPFDLEAKKSGSPQGTTIMGSGVFGVAMAKALFRYGTWDGYWFTTKHRPTEHFLDKAPEFAEAGGRARMVSLNEVSEARSLQVQLVTVGAVLTGVLPLRAVLQRKDMPICGFIHSLHGRSFANGLLQSLLEDLRPAPALVCSSRAGRQAVESMIEMLRERLPGIPDRELHLPVIPLGVDCEQISSGDRSRGRACLGLPDDAVAALYFGRFSKASKGDLVPLLRAFARVRTDRDFRLILAGDDTQFHLCESLRAEAHELGCGPRIHFALNPTTPQKWDLYASADFFVSPADNIQETFGITLAEALAAGLPVVASDWNGYRDLVVDGESGFLIPTQWFLPEDESIDGYGWDAARLAERTILDVELLSQRLQTLADSPGLRVHMAERNRARARQLFDWHAVIRQYEELWSWQHKQAQQRCGASSVEGITTLSPVHVFAHYASRMARPDDRLTLADNTLDRETEACLLPLAKQDLTIRELRNRAIACGVHMTLFDDVLARAWKTGGVRRVVKGVPDVA